MKRSICLVILYIYVIYIFIYSLLAGIYIFWSHTSVCSLRIGPWCCASDWEVYFLPLLFSMSGDLYLTPGFSLDGYSPGGEFGRRESPFCLNLSPSANSIHRLALVLHPPPGVGKAPGSCALPVTEAVSSRLRCEQAATVRAGPWAPRT